MDIKSQQYKEGTLDLAVFNTLGKDERFSVTYSIPLKEKDTFTCEYFSLPTNPDCPHEKRKTIEYSSSKCILALQVFDFVINSSK